MKLRQFLARRRWQRFGQAIRAMKKMSGDRIKSVVLALMDCNFRHHDQKEILEE